MKKGPVVFILLLLSLSWGATACAQEGAALSPDRQKEFLLRLEANLSASRTIQAKFTQEKTQIEADTVVIKAKGDAESIKIRGEALKADPGFIALQIVEKWDGKSPLVVGGGASGANILLPMADLQKYSATNQ